MDVEDIFEDVEYLDSHSRFRAMPQQLRDWYAWDALRMQPRHRRFRMIDVGAGQGQFTEPLMRAATDVHGHAHLTLLDRSKLMYETLCGLGSVSADATTVVHQELEAFAALPKNTGSFDLVFASESLHLLGRFDHALGQLSSLLSPNGTLAIRMATREQVGARSWFRWYPSARTIDEARHPTRRSLVGQLLRAGFDAQVHAVDESRWIEMNQFRALFMGRAFSSMRLMSEEAYLAGNRQMETEIAGQPDLWLDYPMTWVVATKGDRSDAGRRAKSAE